MTPSLPAALLATLAALGPAQAQNRVDLIRPDAPELAARGPFAVGVRQVTLTNPDQIDVVNSATEVKRADRALTVEVWYPAPAGTPPGTDYATILRDGVTPVTLRGMATRDAAAAPGPFPLVIVSHGYPGNRFLLSHLTENLASKGYVVAAIDHTDSTYDNQLAFGSTLMNRPLDQAFVLDALADPATLGTDLAGRIDAGNTAVVGYSMGGYGALIFGGAGVTQAATELPFAPPNGMLAAHLAGSGSHKALMDDRLKAVIAIGPWGRNAGFWDDAGLAGLRVPALIMAGSVDTVSGYDPLREIFAGASGTTRHLLTFQNAGHNAAAPIPAPVESWPMSEKLGWAPFGHYADPVWDSVRMNNVAQHFATAFLDLHLKGDATRAPYLDLVPNGVDGVWSVKDGVKAADHNYWPGFEQGSAAGLSFETLPKP